MHNKRALFILLIISFILTFSWFRPGLTIGGAEESLSFYNIQRSAELYKYTWDKSTSSPATAIVSRYPTFYLLGQISKLGISTNIIQITTFFAMTLISALAIYLLARVFLLLSPTFSLIAALFYILNPFMFSSIWNRYLIAMMFFMPLLPLSLYAFFEFINNKKTMILLFLGISFVFSPAFSLPSNIITLWIVIFLFAFSLILGNIQKPKIIPYIITWFGVFFTCWILTNSWWLSSFGAQASSEYSQYFSVSDNLYVLRSISQQYPFLNNIILGHPRFFFQPYQVLTGYIMLLICIIGLQTFTRGRIKFFLILLLILAYFFMNGSNWPTGWIFEMIFSGFTPFQTYRNHYEKFGIVLVLTYSLLFSLGIQFLYRVFKKVSIAFLILIFSAFIWPWTKSVFGDKEVNMYVKIPNEYESVNNILNSDNEDFRVLHLPLIPGGGLSYKWPNPYFGLTPTPHLFDKSSIDGSLSKTEPDLYRRILDEGFHSGEIAKLFKYGNIKYLLFHKDLDSNYSGAESTEEAQKYLETILAADPTSQVDICNVGSGLKLIDIEKYKFSCSLNSENSNWLSFNYLIVELNSSFGGNLRIDVIDSNRNRIYFDGSLDNRYKYPDNKTTPFQKFFLNLKAPTGRYGEFNTKNVVAILIQFTPLTQESNQSAIILKIAIEGSKEKNITYLDPPIWRGNLGLFKIKPQYFYPKIYATSQIETLDNWQEIIRSEKDPKAFIFSRHKESNVNYDLVYEKFPKLTTERINPTKYTIKVENAVNPFWLIFSENFNSDWQASADGKSFPHIQVNGFANGYFVDKVGNYTLELEYLVQKKAEIHKMISSASFAIIICVSLVIELFKKRLPKITFNLRKTVSKDH